MNTGEESHRSIRLIEPACTSCMICARECPTWCISIDSHAEAMKDLPSGSRQRTENVLDRFAIDWSLCMYCGICIEECPYDALEWVGNLTGPGFASESLVEEMVEHRRWAAAPGSTQIRSLMADQAAVRRRASRRTC